MTAKTQQIEVYKGSIELFSDIPEFMKSVKKEITKHPEITKQKRLINKHVKFESSFNIETLNDKENLTKRAAEVKDAIKEIQTGIKIGNKSYTFQELRRKANEVGSLMKEIEDDIIKPGLEMIEKSKKKVKKYILEQKQAADKLKTQLEEQTEKSKEIAENKANYHEEKGNKVKAEYWRNVAATKVSPKVVDVGTKDESSTSKDTLKVEVIDKMEAIKQIALGNLPIGAVELNMSVLRKYCEDQQLMSMPGLSIQKDVNIRLK